MACPLLHALPPELRLEIYRFVFRGLSVRYPSHPGPSLGDGLLRTCRQVRQEAIGVSFETQDFSVRTLEEAVRWTRSIGAANSQHVRQLSLPTPRQYRTPSDVKMMQAPWILTLRNLPNLTSLCLSEQISILTWDDLGDDYSALSWNELVTYSGVADAISGLDHLESFIYERRYNPDEDILPVILPPVGNRPKLRELIVDRPFRIHLGKETMTSYLESLTNLKSLGICPGREQNLDPDDSVLNHVCPLVHIKLRPQNVRPDLLALVRHARTLTSLKLGTWSETSDSYEAADTLSKVLTHLVHLKSLGIDFIPSHGLPVLRYLPSNLEFAYIGVDTVEEVELQATFPFLPKTCQGFRRFPLDLELVDHWEKELNATGETLQDFVASLDERNLVISCAKWRYSKVQEFHLQKRLNVRS